MDTHHIHDEKIGFHSGAENTRYWLEHGLTREGFGRLTEEAKSKGKVKFTNAEGRKFDLEFNKEENKFSVRPHY